MDEQVTRRPPLHVVEALEASVKDIAEGDVREADFVQVEAQNMLADHEDTAPATPKRAARRTRPH